jgi:hypothetical protein
LVINSHVEKANQQSPIDLLYGHESFFLVFR